MNTPLSPVIQCEITKQRDFEQLRLYLTTVFKCFQDKTNYWIFRGQNDATWTLSTTLERFVSSQQLTTVPCPMPSLNDELRTIMEYYQKLKTCSCHTHTPHTHPRSKTKSNLPPYLKSLVDIQHYGGKTRLLDFTESLDIALYFAITQAGHPGTPFVKTTTPVIWAINYRDLFKRSRHIGKYVDRKCSQLKNHISPTMLDEDPFIEESFRDSLIDYLSETVGPSMQQRALWITRLLHRETHCLDIIPIFPRRSNARIKAQKGLFLCPTTFQPFEENLLAALNMANQPDILRNPPLVPLKDIPSYVFTPTPPVIKVLLQHGFLPSAATMLNSKGIHTATLFPDKSGIITSLTYLR